MRKIYGENMIFDAETISNFIDNDKMFLIVV